MTCLYSTHFNDQQTEPFLWISFHSYFFPPNYYILSWIILWLFSCSLHTHFVIPCIIITIIDLFIVHYHFTHCIIRSFWTKCLTRLSFSLISSFYITLFCFLRTKDVTIWTDIDVCIHNQILCCLYLTNWFHVPSSFSISFFGFSCYSVEIIFFYI